MVRPRLRRQRELPAAFGERTYREAIALPQIQIGCDGLAMEYSVSAPYFVGRDDDIPLDEVRYHLRCQTCRGWIRFEGAFFGGLDIRRFIIPPFMENEELLDLMDRESHEMHDLSCALVQEFERLGEEVSDYSEVVELNRMWLQPHPATAGRSGEIVSKLVAAVFPEFSLLVLKAYPLEYEGNLPEGSPMRPAFKRRQAALMRHYARTLNVAPMSGRYGEEGWMFRFHDPSIPADGLTVPS